MKNDLKKEDMDETFLKLCLVCVAVVWSRFLTPTTPQEISHICHSTAVYPHVQKEKIKWYINITTVSINALFCFQCY